MRIMVIGAYGLLGGYVAARLVNDGHQVLGIGRDVGAAARRFPAVEWAQADLRTMSVERWRPLLAGIGAVVNCAGALQDSLRDDLDDVHLKATRTLAVACEEAGVCRLVQISAAGVENGAGRFRETKRRAEDALSATALDWVILRPGVVLAPAAYGGSGLMRGLAAFPGAIPALYPRSVVQIVAVEDVAEAVARSVLSTAPARIVCDLVGPEPTHLADLLIALREWLGLPAAPVIGAPAWIGRIVAIIADVLGWLGWRSPMRSAALQQLALGVSGRSQDAELLGVVPRSLHQTLAQWPSGVQERWYARLYFVKPLVLATLGAFWVASGVIGLVNRDAAMRVLTDASIGEGLAKGLVIVGSLADIALGTLVCARRTAPLSLKGMVLIGVGYMAAAVIWTPHLWLDPLGPMMKTIPTTLLALTALGFMDER